MNQTTQEIILIIVKAIVAVAMLLITKYLIPFVKQKTTINQREYIVETIKLLIKGAESLYGSGTGTAKYEYVYNRLTLALNRLGIKLTKEEIESMIEGVLKDIKLTYDHENFETKFIADNSED